MSNFEELEGKLITKEETTEYEKDLHELAKLLAEEEINEHLAHHPEHIPDRDKILNSKINQIEKSTQAYLEEINTDFGVVSEQLANFLEIQPPDFIDHLKPKIEAMMSALRNFKQLAANIQNPESTMQQLLGIDNEIMDLLYLLGKKNFEQGNFANAKAIYRILIILNPNYPNFWNSLGLSYMNLNRLEEAEYSFKMALNLFPDCPETFYFLAMTYVKLNYKDKALEHYEKVKEIGIEGSESTLEELKNLIERS